MIFTPNVEKIVHYALVKRRFSQQNISKQFGISKGYVSRIINQLIKEGMIARSKHFRYEVTQPTRLLLLWAVHRKAKNPVFRTTLPLRDNEVEEWLRKEFPEHVLGLTKAFSKYTGAKTVYTEVYLPRNSIHRLFNKTGFAKKGNIVVFEATDNELFGAENNICSKYLTFTDMYAKGLNQCFRILEILS